MAGEQLRGHHFDYKQKELAERTKHAGEMSSFVPSKDFLATCEWTATVPLKSKLPPLVSFRVSFLSRHFSFLASLENH